MGYKYIFFSFSIAVLFSCNTPAAKGPNGLTFKNAVEYNDYIISRQTRVINHILAISNAFTTDLELADALLDKAALTTDSVLTDIKGMSDFKGDSTFKASAIANLQFYGKLFKSDYKKMVEINKKGENATQADFETLQSIQTNIATEEVELDKRLNNAQQEFSRKNKMPVGVNAVQKKIDAMD